MIVSGKSAIARCIIGSLRNVAVQGQPCGVDLSLCKIFTWTSAGTVDFSNQYRAGSETEQLQLTGSPKSIHLGAGNYMVEFNEQVDIPLDIMGQVFVRSSLWRSGALLSAGVVSEVVSAPYPTGSSLRMVRSPALAGLTSPLDGQRLQRCCGCDAPGRQPPWHHPPRERKTRPNGLPRDVGEGRRVQRCVSRSQRSVMYSFLAKLKDTTVSGSLEKSSTEAISGTQPGAVDDGKDLIHNRSNMSETTLTVLLAFKHCVARKVPTADNKSATCNRDRERIASVQYLASQERRGGKVEVRRVRGGERGVMMHDANSWSALGGLVACCAAWLPHAQVHHKSGTISSSLRPLISFVGSATCSAPTVYWRYWCERSWKISGRGLMSL